MPWQGEGWCLTLLWICDTGSCSHQWGTDPKISLWHAGACGSCVPQHFPGPEAILAADLWPERRIHSLLVCAVRAHQQSQPHPQVTWWPWNPEMGQKLHHIKLLLKVQICLGDLPGKWAGVSISSWLNPPLHLVMGCKSLCSVNRTVTRYSGMFCWTDQSRSSVALSGSYFCWQSCHLFKKTHLLLVMMVILLPSSPHLFIALSPTNRIRSWIFLFAC